MPVFRTEKVKDYAVIAKHHLKNKNLSYKAKGLMTFMLSVPDDWDYSLYGLSTLSSDGIDGVRSGIRELEKHGYLTRRRIRDAGGKLGDIEYTVHEIPQPPHNGDPMKSYREPPIPNEPGLEKPILENPILVEPVSAKPILGFPTLDKPTQEIPTQLSNKALSNNGLNINESSNKQTSAPPKSAHCISDNQLQLLLNESNSFSQQDERLTVQKAQGAGKNPVDHAMTLVGQQFELFWQLYPRKAGKKVAKRAWVDINPDELLLATIMGALKVAIQYWNNHSVSVKHIPHPSTWLIEERWEDEFTTEQLSQAPQGSIVSHSESQGGVRNATIGADYSIGGKDDPYRAIISGQ
ncbi:MAG: helix-turn-helix domain-containing protein [Defluviitaleaceae bacterium]|nr:helix-turn-helix domain-containing protein [Defluviitaleaceae bacterium]